MPETGSQILTMYSHYIDKDRKGTVITTTYFFYKGYSVEQKNYLFFINGIQTTFGTLQHCKEYIDKQEKQSK